MTHHPPHDPRRPSVRGIANGKHAGHDRETVGRIMTSDAILDKIRAGYERHTVNGKTPKDAT
ncbi:hypothetical protein ACIRJM_22145 [Streptomyces sp. NPDC102405]|uniref:hypothetical protein n=1 Tax=Streptomyces sp. NPDC102405 TaxID=3366170 RepID=UPI00380E9D38